MTRVRVIQLIIEQDLLKALERTLVDPLDDIRLHCGKPLSTGVSEEDAGQALVLLHKAQAHLRETETVLARVAAGGLPWAD